MASDRNQPLTEHRLAGRLLLVSGMVWLASGPAFAQTATLPSTKAAPAETVRSGHRTIPSTGVIVPNTTVDPGMKVKSPAMPAQSMPVIRPEPVTPNDGRVVVPR